ncbi:TetR/AcrR family transcriptional regulator [Spongiibacter sp. KMU-158]|jgi:TetR/AcrR family transcriptional repressor of mexJK operon|uniref:TetR/AcrR family transcriptional regulator n=1 Tax=Spongiibacter pelagi TaxID=2760804 RepID=A0A927C4V7_9GAMM|nr:TetR/AcrR family transcriptional regulator [Spongiibacter pelagi]MBD2860198.1 TetR/AcrR family transcriptional regulator [Spongiibacter pelagi]
MKSTTPTVNERERTDSTSSNRKQVAQPGRPIDKDKDQAILEAARALLFGEGPQAVTMEAVAKLAGVSKVTLYTRHSNRNELIAAVMRRQAEIFAETITLIPGVKPNANKSLLDFSLAILKFLVDQEHLQFMRALNAAHGTELDLQFFYLQGPQKTVERLSQWLTALAQAGEIECDDSIRAAEIFLGMLMRLDLVRGLYGIPIDNSLENLTEHAEFVVTSFLKLHKSTE